MAKVVAGGGEAGPEERLPLPAGAAPGPAPLLGPRTPGSAAPPRGWKTRTAFPEPPAGGLPTPSVFPVFRMYQRNLNIWFRYSLFSLKEQHVYFHLLSQPVFPWFCLIAAAESVKKIKTVLCMV